MFQTASKKTKARFCDNCGTEIAAGDRYCSYCGQSLAITALTGGNVGAGLLLEDNIISALNFINKLKAEKEDVYWEVLDSGHGDHKVWPQSQFLLYALFTKLGLHDQNYLASAARIICNNDLTVWAVDRLIRAGERFCILLGDTEDFYLKDCRLGSVLPHSDENALLLLYRLLTNEKTDADNLFGNLEEMWDDEVNMLGMDAADRSKEKPQYAVYKTSLFGIAAKAIGNSKWASIVQSRLRQLQTGSGPCSGGWKTEMLPRGTLDGAENIETTALSIIALLP